MAERGRIYRKENGSEGLARSSLLCCRESHCILAISLSASGPFFCCLSSPLSPFHYSPFVKPASGASFSPCLWVSIAAVVMSQSSPSQRKRPTPLISRDGTPKRSRTSNPPHPPSLPPLQLESEVADLGAKVLAFREKGLQFFATLSEQRARANQEGAPYTAPTESRDAHKHQRQALKERLALANETMPTLLKELAMWNTKIRQAVDVQRKGHRLPFLDTEPAGT